MAKPGHVDETEAAEYIGMSVHYLRRDRCEGVTGNRTQGPPFYRIGRRIFYRIADLDAWMEQHRVERPIAQSTGDDLPPAA